MGSEDEETAQEADIVDVYEQNRRLSVAIRAQAKVLVLQFLVLLTALFTPALSLFAVTVFHYFSPIIPKIVVPGTQIIVPATIIIAAGLVSIILKRLYKLNTKGYPRIVPNDKQQQSGTTDNDD